PAYASAHRRTPDSSLPPKAPASWLLATAPTARRARRDRRGLELFEVLEHADHRVARGRVRLVRDRAAQADAQLGAQLRLDESVGAQGLLGVVMMEVRLTTRGGDADGRQGRSAAARLRGREFLH